MTVSPEELELAGAFPAAERDRWRELVKGVLRKSGAATDGTPLDAVEELLTTTTYDGVAVAPLYTADDVGDSPGDGLAGTAATAATAGTARLAVGRPGVPAYVREISAEPDVPAGWDVRQRHAHPDPAVTRDAVIGDLENGVTSLWLAVGDAGVPVGALRDVLAGVHLDLAPVVLDAGAVTDEAAGAFLALVAERGAEAHVMGGLGADPLGRTARTGTAVPLGPAADLAVRCVREFPGLRAITVDATVHHDAGGSDAQELGCSIAAGVAYLRALTEAGLTVDEAFGQLEFRYAATADQFLTIAKLRAARRLWSRIADVCGATADGPAGGQRQHAVTSSAMMTRRDPWVNMLRTTLACFAAGVGGADAVTVQPFDACLGLPDDFARRIARNTQSLLLEESSLSRVVDPAGGSWYVESLTERLAQAAWTWFTEIEQAGGLAAALSSGLVAEQLAGTRAARDRDIAHRRFPITGVSEFPNLAERLPERTEAPAPAPAPVDGSHGLARIRYAEAFETLRDRSDAHLAATGERPRVFLATLGPVAANTARTTFAANLFQAGGIETVTGGPEEYAASGALIACLCSSDKIYATEAAAAAQTIRAAGARRVWVAGKGSYDGVDANVFAGCDAIATLTEALRLQDVAG